MAHRAAYAFLKPRLDSRITASSYTSRTYARPSTGPLATGVAFIDASSLAFLSVAGRPKNNGPVGPLTRSSSDNQIAVDPRGSKTTAGSIG